MKLGPWQGVGVPRGADMGLRGSVRATGARGGGPGGVLGETLQRGFVRWWEHPTRTSALPVHALPTMCPFTPHRGHSGSPCPHCDPQGPPPAPQALKMENGSEGGDEPSLAWRPSVP